MEEAAIGQGKTSGVNLEQLPQHSAYVFHAREGKVTRLVFYMNRDRALADLGLAESSRFVAAAAKREMRQLGWHYILWACRETT
jgi:hypothetical protein